MKPTTRLILVCAGFLAMTSSVWAASLYTETFTVPADGWQDRDAGKMSITWQASGGNPGGCLRGSFSRQAYPSPQNDGLITTGGMVSAAFTGNYREAGIRLLGFDFMAADAIPAVAEVRLHAGDHYVSRFFHTGITSTGVWHSFRFPLHDGQAGGWLAGSAELGEVMEGVSRVEFVINRANESAQSVYVDNIFVDALPESDGLSFAPGTGPRMAWQNVRPGDVYRIEAAPDITAPVWDVIMVVTAQTSTIEMNYEASGRQQFFRIVWP